MPTVGHNYFGWRPALKSFAGSDSPSRTASRTTLAVIYLVTDSDLPAFLLFSVVAPLAARGRRLAEPGARRAAGVPAARRAPGRMPIRISPPFYDSIYRQWRYLHSHYPIRPSGTTYRRTDAPVAVAAAGGPAPRRAQRVNLDGVHKISQQIF